MYNQFDISVCVITYNHSSFIKKCLDNILCQKLNYNWEIIIADDYSTDGTREILKDYKNRNSDKIKLILQEKNVGAAQNWMDLIQMSNSKYIAYIEGDDFWCDENKLQKQVDFLINNPKYVICSHNVYLEINGNLIAREKLNSEYRFNDFLKSSIINSVSIVYRNTKLPDWIINCPFGDWGLYLYLSKFGKTAVLDDYSAVYRIHNQGIYTGLNNKNEKMISFLEFIKEHFPENKEEINKIIIDKKVFLGLTSLSIGSILSGKTTFKELIYFFKTMVLRKLKRNTSHGVSHNH